MARLSALNTISNDEKLIKVPQSVPVRIAPAYGGAPLIELNSNGGIFVITATGSAYNLTPNVAFTAMVEAWGAGGASGSVGAGGGSGYSVGIINFQAGVSYNVVASVAGPAASAAGGGGSGVEFLANSDPILIAGGGGGGGSSGSGGAGGGYVAANSTGGSIGATVASYGPGALYRKGGTPSTTYIGMGFGGSSGGGGGGMYGGQGSPTAGGGGGSGFLNSTLDFATGNSITGSGISAGYPNHPLRGNSGNAVNSGIVIITLIA